MNFDLSRLRILRRQVLGGATDDRSLKFVFAAISACFFLSGFAALLYQTAWFRLFSAIFGTSELAVATVLATYMGGLSLGAAIAGRFMNRVSRPVLLYGLLEAGIAISALCVPVLLDLAGLFYQSLLGGLAEPPSSSGLARSVYYFMSSFLILLLPTGFMGATLPLLSRYAIRENKQVGPRIGWLYGLNTLGAVAGAIISAFFLLPSLGLYRTTFVGVTVNVVIFLIILSFARFTARQPPSNSSKAAEPVSDEKRPSWILPLMLVSGGTAFLYEVLWTRLLSHVLGGSVYAFATMLASFLTGIAIGGFLSGKFATTKRQAGTLFALSQFAVAVTSAGIYSWLQVYVPDVAGLSENAMLAFIVMLPSTLFIGATFPLAVRMLSTSAESSAVATASVYSWNTVGAIVGSLLAAFYVIPGLGFEGAIRFAVGINLAIGVAVVFTRFGKKSALTSAFACLLLLLFYKPTAPLGLLDTSIIDQDRGGQEIFYGVGRSATVLLKQRDGQYFLRTNGLPEAFIEPAGAPPKRHSQKWLTALPLLARPHASSVLIVGLGGGVAVEGIPPSVSEIDVIELEPEVVKAMQAISDKRNYDPLADGRVRIIENDARGALSMTTKTYDVIVSQPSHPWTAGASHLYTREYLAIAKDHLAPSGVFVQWINSTFIDAPLLRSLTATLLNQFSYVRLYQPTPTTLLFLASEETLDTEALFTADPDQVLGQNRDHYSLLGINATEDLLVALTATTAGLKKFSFDALLMTDDHNRMAMHRPFSGASLSYEELFSQLSPYDPLLQKGSIYLLPDSGVDLAYVGERLISSGFALRAAALAERTSGSSLSHTIDGIGFRYAGLNDASTQAFRKAVQVDRENEQAKYALIWPFLGQLVEGSAPHEIVDQAAELSESAHAIVKGWGMAHQRNWSGLASMDLILSEVKPTDFWFQEAVKLRSDWRIQGGVSADLSAEALGMLDRALIVNSLTDLLVIRAAAAIRLRDPDLFVETASVIADQIGKSLDRQSTGELVISDRHLFTIKNRVAGFLGQLSYSRFTKSGAQFTILPIIPIY